MPMRILIFIAFLFVCIQESKAATITAVSCSQADVQTAVNSSVNGDTVIIPNGACTWSGELIVSKQIILTGASVPFSNCTSAQCTIITDTNPNPEGGPACSSGDLICVTIGSSFHSVVANLSFITSAGVGSGNYIVIQGTGMVPLMHDIFMNIPDFVLSHAIQWLTIGGVMWNMNLFSTNNLAGGCAAGDIGSNSGSIVIKSPTNWDTASTMGSLDSNGDQNVYIEDSTLTYVGQIPDVDDNGRVVFRYNNLTNVTGGLTHGTTSTYGGRHVELYHNTWHFTNTNQDTGRYFWFRAGTSVVWGNAVDANTGGCHGARTSFQYTVENAARAGSHNCCLGYMCFHQSGSGANGSVQSPTNLDPSQTPAETFQLSDPVYIWGNTGTGATAGNIFSTNDGSPRDCNATNPGTGQPYTTADFFHLNRDYFIDNSGSLITGAKPGYTAYTYPHPLRSQFSNPSPPAPCLPMCLVQEFEPSVSDWRKSAKKTDLTQ